MKRFLVVGLAVGMLFAACGEGEEGIDPEAIGEIFDAIQDAAEEAEAANNAANDANDANDPSGENGEAPANSGSPTRPPILPGGDQTETSRDEDWLGQGEARNTEEFTYGPTDAAHEDIIDFYTETYGEPFFSGESRTDWSSDQTGDGSVVSVSNDGFDTTVFVQYDD